jgi:hypothetical protein
MVKKTKKKKQQKPWQFKFTMGLTAVMLLLVAGYFFQSFLEIRESKPVQVAIERLSDSGKGDGVFKGGNTGK